MYGLNEVGVFYGSWKMARIPSLKSLNAFPHAEEHLLKKTYSGAMVWTMWSYSFVIVAS
jgi:hypothetical protein